jgi:hypothetical protein
LETGNLKEEGEAMKKRWAMVCVWLWVLLCLAAAAQAQKSTSGGSGQALLNLDNTVALHGYDPVAYFEDNEAVQGKKSIFERLGGATYWFSSRASRYAFLKNAPKYQPQFGGYCATSLAAGRLEDINPDEFAIYNGKLFLFRDGGARNVFLSDPARISYQATQQFFRIASQQRQNY